MDGGQLALGLLQVGILGLSLGVSIAVPVILYAKKKSDDTANDIKNDIKSQLKEMSDKISYLDREIYPAVKNGKIVTSEYLGERVEALEAASKRRHEHTKGIISSEINHLKEMIERFEASNKVDHTFTKKDLEEIFKATAKQILLNG